VDNTGLLGLVEALKSGLDPAVGMQLYGQYQADQAQQEAERKARLDQYSAVISGAATSGVPYAGAYAQAQALPGRMPNQAQQALGQLYPNSGPNAPQPQYGASGAQLDFPSGSRPTPSGMTPPTPQGMQYPVPQAGPEATSVAMDPNIALQQQAQQLQIAQAMAPPAPTAGQIEDQQFSTLVQGIRSLFDKGKSPDEVKALIMSDPEFAGVFVSNFQDIVRAFPEFFQV